MTDSITMNEFLARYITSSRWLRQDQTVKQDAFIPPENSLELSVTRHINLTEGDLWRIGKGVAVSMSRNLRGRADVKATYVVGQSLSVVPQPIPDNYNHANIIGWCLEKDKRKMQALEIARVARFVRFVINSEIIV